MIGKKELTLLFCKTSCRQCKDVNNQTWNSIRQTLKHGRSVARHTKRYARWQGIASNYHCQGVRKDPKGRILSHYSLKHNATAEDKLKLIRGFSFMVSTIESISTHLLDKFETHYRYRNVKEMY